MSNSVFDDGAQVPSAPSVEGLIARLEAASEGSIDLDAAIAVSLGHQPDIDLGTCRAGGREFDMVRYTASLDAALTLIPRGNYWVSVEEQLTEEPPKRWLQWLRQCGRNTTPKSVYMRQFNKKWHVSGGPGGERDCWQWWQASVDLGTMTGMIRHQGHSERGTPALALCIAALKARAASSPIVG